MGIVVKYAHYNFAIVFLECQTVEPQFGVGKPGTGLALFILLNRAFHASRPHLVTLRNLLRDHHTLARLEPVTMINHDIYFPMVTTHGIISDCRSRNVQMAPDRGA